jgi:hypothetical protein
MDPQKGEHKRTSELTGNLAVSFRTKNNVGKNMAGIGPSRCDSQENWGPPAKNMTETELSRRGVT